MKFIDIFIEAAWDLSVVPGHQNTFYAVILFDQGQSALAVALAALGALVGLTINWFIGRKIGEYLLTQPYAERFSRVKAPICHYGWPLLLLSWVPLGNFFSIFAAVFGMPLKRTLILAGGAMLGFYVYQSLMAM